MLYRHLAKICCGSIWESSSLNTSNGFSAIFRYCMRMCTSFDQNGHLLTALDIFSLTFSMLDMHSIQGMLDIKFKMYMMQFLFDFLFSKSSWLDYCRREKKKLKIKRKVSAFWQRLGKIKVSRPSSPIRTTSRTSTLMHEHFVRDGKRSPSLRLRIWFGQTGIRCVSRNVQSIKWCRSSSAALP